MRDVTAGALAVARASDRAPSSQPRLLSSAAAAVRRPDAAPSPSPRPASLSLAVAPSRSLPDARPASQEQAEEQRRRWRRSDAGVGVTAMATTSAPPVAVSRVASAGSISRSVVVDLSKLSAAASQATESSSSSASSSSSSADEEDSDTHTSARQGAEGGDSSDGAEDESTLKGPPATATAASSSTSDFSSSDGVADGEGEAGGRSRTSSSHADGGTSACGEDFRWLRSGDPNAALAAALATSPPPPPPPTAARPPRGASATSPPPMGGGGGSRTHSLERGRRRRHHAASRAQHPPPCCARPCSVVAAGGCVHGGCGGGCGWPEHWEPWCCAWRSRSLCHWEHAPPLPPPYSKPSSDVEERVRRLESDKEQLALQVAVLSEQIDVQTEKISDLEKALDEKRRQLAHAENLLQTEMLARSSLETHKLELLSALSELKLQQAAVERENLELRERLSEERRRHKPPLAPQATRLTSTPFTSPQQQSNAQLLMGTSPSPSPVSSMSDGSPRRLGSEDIPQPRTPPATFRRKVDHYGSLPRQRAGSGSALPSDTAPGLLDPNAPLGLLDPNAPLGPLGPNATLGLLGPNATLGLLGPNPAAAGRKGVAFAETERIVIEDHPDSVGEEKNIINSFSPQPSPLLQPQKNKGIKKIFGRIKRSNSGTLEDLPGEGEFRRGGVRATAGARLGWGTTSNSITKPDLPFSQWDSEAISQWLADLGLECYANDARRWVKSGAQLLSASTHEIDKELGIKSTLHRKKLQLALWCEAESSIGRPEDPHLLPAGRLDSAWVLRWLDDVGLPQHKEAFLAARVDGRVLHRLTTDDLALLHLSSSLHVASLRRGIQVLREQGFDPNCLLRRSLPEENGSPTPQDVSRWTNHRVMEWLRVVDLAEYAPNLRGSGVHGGLMVYEPRFTAELLASLLSIPPSKTLLRRHLNTHFKELLGRECIQEKREAEATLGYVPLSATTKVKLAKKSQFTLKRKKSKAEMDMGDLVCPLDPSKPDVTCEQSSKGRGCLSGN